MSIKSIETVNDRYQNLQKNQLIKSKRINSIFESGKVSNVFDILFICSFCLVDF